MATIPDPKDVTSVGTRVSWSAIVAGALIALAVSISLGVLGVALSLSLSDNVGEQTFNIGAVVWTILTIIVSLFLGGYTASLATAGETKGEALVYGVLVWALLYLVLPVTVGLGATYGFGSLIGKANLAGTPQEMKQAAPEIDEERLKKAGVSDEQIEKYKEAGKEVKETVKASNPTAFAWWAFGGIVLSLVASIMGAIAGAGPELVFGYLYRRGV